MLDFAQIILVGLGMLLATVGAGVACVIMLRIMATSWFWIFYRWSQYRARAETVHARAWNVSEPPQGIPILAKLDRWGPAMGQLQGGWFQGSGFRCPANRILGWLKIPHDRAHRGDDDSL